MEGEFILASAIIVGGALALGPYIANGYITTATATVKLIHETFASATEKQITETLDNPQKKTP